MKKIWTLLAFIFFAVVSYSKEIPLEKAYQMAEEFFGITAETKDTGVGVRLLWDGNGLASRSANATPAFYVFGRTGAEGFVIVAGDDALRPVLAWSDEGEFNVDDIPANSLWWYESVERLVTFHRSSSSAPYSYDTLADESEILVPTAEWNQKDPYNKECPLDNSSRQCVTGCVATAMAIVMHQRRWPDAGIGTVPAYKTSKGIEVKERVLGQKYEWNNLPFTDASDINSKWSDGQKNEIARIMADCGAAIQANYGFTETSGSEERAVQAMVEYMSYDRSAHLDWRGYYTDEEWSDMLKKELFSNGAVLYSANNDDGGHAFIIDGYSSEGLFHVNWGWGGSSNAYYHLFNMNPSGSAYADDHNMIVNLKPEEGGESVERILFYCTETPEGQVLKGLHVEETDPVTGLPTMITLGGFWNKGLDPYIGKFRLGVFDRDMNLKQELWTYHMDYLVQSSYLWFSDIPIEIGEVDFGYRIVAQFYNNITGEWEKVRASSEYDGVSEILLADEYPIEESTTFSYIAVNDMIVISVKAGVSVSCTDEEGQGVEVVEVSSGEYHIDASVLDDGVHVLHLEKGEEKVEFEFVTGGQK